MGNDVIFNIGSQHNYDLMSSKDQNSLYFTNDSMRIYKGRDLYSKGIPQLSDTQKEQLKQLMDEYLSIRKNNSYIFTYQGSHTRNAYAEASTAASSTGKAKVNCETFAQLIWMGRSPHDFMDMASYSPTITKSFNWGYYFDFPLRNAYNVKYPKLVSGSYWPGFYNPVSSDYWGDWDSDGNIKNFAESYSYGSYYDNDVVSDDQKQWPLSFMDAGNLAMECIINGWDIPLSEVQIGDMLFMRSPSLTDGRSDDFHNKVYEHISHAALCYGKDSLGLPILIESTDGWNDTIMCTGLGPKCESILPNNHSESRWAWTRARTADLLSRIVLCARHPAAFGIASNVPEIIVAK